MEYKNTVSEYIKNPIKEADRFAFIKNEKKENKRMYMFSIFLLVLLPVLKIAIEIMITKGIIGPVFWSGKINMPLINSLIANVLAIPSCMILYYLIRNTSNKFFDFAVPIIIPFVLFVMSIYYNYENGNISNITLFDLVIYNMITFFIAASILFTLYMIVDVILVKRREIIRNNKTYIINEDSLKIINKIDENILINENSKIFIDRIKNLKRLPYKFELDIIKDMNLEEYEERIGS